MPFMTPGAQPLAYTLEGAHEAPVVLFSNSLGATLASWDRQAAALAPRYRVLRYDTRGHGGSPAVPGQACTLQALGEDVLRLLDACGIERVHYCGISLGGLTGLWLAVHAPQRIERLVVANSAARIGAEEGWRQRAAQVRAASMAGVADGAAQRWFTPDFRAQAPGVVAGLVDGLRRCDPAGYAACCDALAGADLRADIQGIVAPTLLVAGRHDPVTTVADAYAMRDAVKGARCIELDASHLSNIEAEQAFTQALLDFLAGSG
ncbi:3-oxoadipate enol-lactonase [Telluria beijingensis]|uniref:3-oxoadipate enol-lactonase n=1 Tax=Telluria beijingensis TaxID=3068633 RepID=UPI0027961046|nr:3-oxoadipate enol-lactonase [Massilia sp. REN29]